MNGGSLFVAACFVIAMALAATVTAKVIDLERARVEQQR